MSEPAVTISDSTFYLKITDKYRASKRSGFPVMIFRKSSECLLSQEINMDILFKLQFHRYVFSSLIVENARGMKDLLLRAEKVIPQFILRPALIKNNVLMNWIASIPLFFSERQILRNRVSMVSFTRSVLSRFETMMLYFSRVLQPIFSVPVADLYRLGESSTSGSIASRSAVQ